jgi:hypothetical protein
MQRSAFFSAVRASLFAGKLTQAQVTGFEFLLDSIEAEGDIERNHAAYMLATAFWETAHTMLPVRETLASSDDLAIRVLDNAFARGRLPWVRKPYWRKDASGKSWLGRGYVQLTHKANYEKAAAKLGADLVNHPDLAMSPPIAAQIMIRGMEEGWFTGKTLDDYIDDIDEADSEDLREYRNARPIINGTDKAEQIALIAVRFEAALKAAGA